MKKNLRIVSAAAAALLAVAPVAASAVNVNADVTVNDAPNSNQGNVTAPAGTVTINIAVTATAGETTASQVIKNAKITVDGASTVDPIDNEKQVTLYDVTDKKAVSDDTTLVAGHSYEVRVTDLKLQGLTTGKNYAIAGGKVNDKTAAKATDLMNGVNFTSDKFTMFNKKLTGSPIVTTHNGQWVKSGKGSVTLTTKEEAVSELAKLITDNYNVKMSNKNDTASEVGFENVETSIRNAIKDNNIKFVKDSTTTFKVPATAFDVKLTAVANNGEKTNFTVTVNVPKQTNSASNAPQFTKSNKVFDNNETIQGTKSPYTLKLALNSTFNAASIKDAFSATINGDSSITTPVTVKSSNLNTTVAGKYAVVLEASNPAGKTADVTVNVTVGNPGYTKTVQGGSETPVVVTITGDKVTATSQTLPNGSQVATYGTVKVDGKSYTQLNSWTSDKFVETKYVDGSIKEETTKSAKVMYKSAVYDKDGKSTGKTIGGYKDKDFVTNADGTLKVVPLKVNGVEGKFYQLAKGEGYVRVRNVTGSKMTLKHNAYVYKSNGKRANKKLLKKGHTITVYGGQYKAIKHYGKKAVRIEVNRYVKVANVNYKLVK